jgi:nucleoside-diphosphate-sugar epimerase
MNTALVFGGSGQLGFAVANHLLDQGWSCHVVTRDKRSLSPPLLRKGALPIDGTDRPRADILEEAGQTFDAVFDPTTYKPADAADLLSAQSRFGSMVVVSSSSVYADAEGRTLDEAHQNGFPIFSGAISEENKTVPAGPQTYSTQKIAMENAILESAQPATILRPCAIYGKFARHPREWWFVKRALDGRTRIPIAFKAESRFHTSSANSIATLTGLCMEQPATRILNVADPEPLTVGQIASAIGNAVGTEFDLLAFDGPAESPAYAGSTPWSVERPFYLNTERAKELGWDGGAPYEQEVEAVCNWLVDIARSADWRDHFIKFLEYGRDLFDYVAEDKVIAQLSGHHPLTP